MFYVEKCSAPDNEFKKSRPGRSQYRGQSGDSPRRDSYSAQKPATPPEGP